MLKFLFTLSVVFCYASLAGQPLKIGVFDADIMVQVLPGYQSQVDSVLKRFAYDSLQTEYSFYRQEYSRIDSSYESDSIARKPPAILDRKLRQRQELALTLTNWDRIAEYRIQQKRVLLASPFYDKVLAAYKKVVEREKYALVLKPNTFESFTPVENVFVKVAKELNIQLPAELTSN